MIPEGLDRIDLRGIAAHGFTASSPRSADGQTFIADVSLGLDLGPAAANDDLTATVHYGRSPRTSTMPSPETPRTSLSPSPSVW